MSIEKKFDIPFISDLALRDNLRAALELFLKQQHRKR